MSASKLVATRGLVDEIPDFDDTAAEAPPGGPVVLSSLSTLRRARGLREVSMVAGMAVLVIGGLELLLRLTNTPDFVFPKPTAIASTLFRDFGSLYLTPLTQTLTTFLFGLSIGSTLGLLLAALITQKPWIEKLIAPYIIVMVTTPMIALVPFLMLKFGFGMTPRVIAVSLASGPMVMINSATGFRRTDAALIALGKSYGANTFQIFRKIRFPLALPMIIVGYMVGSIFGLLTTIGAEMVGGGAGLGNRLAFFSSLVRMPEFGAVLTLVAALGVSIYVLFTLIGKRWANWQA